MPDAESWAGIIQAASGTPLGLLALMVMALATLTFLFFRGASVGVKLGVFGVLMLGVVLFAYATLNVRFAGVLARLEDVSEAMESLVIAQPVKELRGKTILLDYDPVPRSVRIAINTLTYYPRPAYGFRLDGRNLVIEDERMLTIVKEAIPADGVTVEYLRRVQ
jgi:hypothetical protein